MPENKKTLEQQLLDRELEGLAQLVNDLVDGISTEDTSTENTEGT